MNRFAMYELTEEQREIAKKSPYSITNLRPDGFFACHYKIEDFLRPEDKRWN